MTSSTEQQYDSQNSTTPSRDSENLPLTRVEQLRLCTSVWDCLTPEERPLFLRTPGNELASAIVDSLTWMSKWTKSRDDQDQLRPYKRLNRPYFKTLHEVWLREPLLYIEKSRSMVTSWWAVAETMHQIMTRQPAKAIFWAQDEDRAVLLRDYAWELYEQQDEQLKKLFPALRPRVKQSYDKLDFADGGELLALPGKDPNKIRSEHPTILVMDEANFIENGGEALDVALASRVPKILLISTAAPSWLRRVTKVAQGEPLP